MQKHRLIIIHKPINMLPSVNMNRNSKHITVKTETGSYDIKASVRIVGPDLLVAVWGGNRPHIGAVAVAQPRPSLRDPVVTSATTSVICLPGHKEDFLAKTMAETLSSALNSVVIVTAGIHWDNISKQGIKIVLSNSKILKNLILDSIANHPVFLKKS